MAVIGYGVLEKNGGKIVELANQFKIGYESLLKEVNNTSNHWKGSAGDSFRSAVASYKPNFDKYYNKISEFGKAVANQGKKYRTLDETKYSVK